METKLTILGQFFENPNKSFSIRQLSRILKINHTTVRQYLNKMVKDEILSLKKEGVDWCLPIYALRHRSAWLGARTAHATHVDVVVATRQTRDFDLAQVDRLLLLVGVGNLLLETLTLRHSSILVLKGAFQNKTNCSDLICIIS